MRSDSIIAVQTILAGGEEAELRFRALFMRQESGTLTLWDRPDDAASERLIMAFAPSTWRGAWVVDVRTTFPLGLEINSAPTSRGPAPLAAFATQSSELRSSASASSAEPDQAWPESYQPAPGAPASVEPAPVAPAPVAPAHVAPAPVAPAPVAPAPVAPAPVAPDPVEPASVAPSSTQTAESLATPEPLEETATMEPKETPLPSGWNAADRDARLNIVASALADEPYAGVANLAQRLGAPDEEAEQALAAAIARQLVPFEAAQDLELQMVMDRVTPDLIREHKPKKPAEIFDLLRQRDDTKHIDMVQLRVWLMRNPPKRPT